MSEQNHVGNDDNAQKDSGSAENQNQQEQYVSRQAYEEVTKDMHKFKRTAKELEAARNEYEAKLKQIEEEKLAEQQRWKELYEKRNEEIEAVKAEAQQKESAYLNSVKKSALKQELGGKIKDAYLVHADLSSIEFNDDGTLNMDSVHEAANRFREEHGELVPKTPSKEATGQAAPTNATVSQGKPIEELSGKEALELFLRGGKPTSYTS